MKRIPRSAYLPWLLLVVGAAFYVNYGYTYNAWLANLPQLVIYVVIILALRWALRKKEKLQREREDGNTTQQH